MIIGITGLSKEGKSRGSGKDTVGLMLQYLIAHPEYEHHHYDAMEYDEYPTYSTYSLAHPAKNIAAKLTNTDRKLWDTVWKDNAVIGNESPREYLIKLCSHLRGFDDSWFLKHIPNQKNIIITDVRFKIEYDYIRNNNGMVLCVQHDIHENPPFVSDYIIHNDKLLGMEVLFNNVKFFVNLFNIKNNE